MRHIRLIVTALGALAIVVSASLVARPAQAGGACRGVPVTDAKGMTVEMKDDCFTPTVLHVRPGDTVTWVNLEREPHTVSGANVAWGDYEDILEGQSVSHQFTASGVYPYYCFIHPGMVGAVIVGDGSGVGAAGAGSVAVQRVGQNQLATQETLASDDDGALLVVGIAAGGAIVFAGAAGVIGYALGRRRRST